MPKIQYENLRFLPATLGQIETANAIIKEYSAEGYSLTLRQLYYQLVARGLLANTQANYKKLGSTISKARRAGLVDWHAIVDRTRFLRKLPSWDTPAAIVQSCAQQFRTDRWEGQDTHVEVWFEKDALLGIFERAADAWRVPYFSCRGYSSDSEVWGAAQRMADTGKPTTVLHFGDHDPSGLDMTRDIAGRLELFGAGQVEVRRLALNMDQVRKYAPPPNPAKETDSRFQEYRRLYGSESWELDALDPKVLVALVQREVKKAVDVDAWNDAVQRENDGRATLRAIADHYPKIEAQMARAGTYSDSSDARML